MLYEKKMLILSGEGKGVVLIEKSAHGVRFSLRTFDMPRCDVLKAGIITRSAVFVRDLPTVDNPAAVFTVDAGDIDCLHFAVFDKSLRLYGTNTKRMWEANLMDLLNKHDRRAPVLDGTPTAALPPIAPKPAVLPMPDGTGIPQSRLAIYGDEAIAESDFYTPLDIRSRMPEVDGFLDSPRILDGLSPRIVPPPNIPARDLPVAEVTATAENISIGYAETTATVDEAESVAEEEPVSEPEQYEPGEEAPPEEIASQPSVDNTGAEVVLNAEDMDSEPTETEKVSVAVMGSAEPVRDAAATVTADLQPDMPWVLTARWLKNRTKREPLVRPLTVRKIEPDDRVRFIRSSEFFERTRKDIETLFASAEKDKVLTELLPDMEWVKVEFDGHTISVGRSANVLLCYAVSGVYEKISPLGDEAQWLPSDRRTPTGKGYWLIFQDLSTGKIIDERA